MRTSHWATGVALPALLAVPGLLAAQAALAQTPASNNQAYINQTAATLTPSLVTNQTIFTQSGSSNRLGAMGNSFLQDGLGGETNVFTATQSSDFNLIGFTAGGAATLPLGQSGRANTATVGQGGGNANAIGSLMQTNRDDNGAGNTLVVTQTGTGNYVLEATQTNNGRAANSATIVQTGDFNGYLLGHVFGNGGTSAINGFLATANRTYIGTADAQVALVFTSNGVSAYAAPNGREGAVLNQFGGNNRADVTTNGTDNNFIVQQNSTTTNNGGGNTLAYTATGSSNYAYALQVGINTASNVVVGNQNAFLVYQAGEAGAGGNGYGNIVTWQQGEKVGDIQNYAEMAQLGTNNTVTGSQLGSLNVYRSYQRGTDNRVAAIQMGSGNLIDVMQVGTGNVATITQGSAVPSNRVVTR